MVSDEDMWKVSCTSKRKRKRSTRVRETPMEDYKPR